MFFIGIFGIQSKTETIKTQTGVLCPVCAAWDRYDIVKMFNYFHFFFIPIWKWNKRYFIKTRCCQRFCALDATVGIRIEAGESVEIEKEHITCSQEHGAVILCPNCREPLEPSHRYCPSCGTEV